jgi:hypothetical protein
MVVPSADTSFLRDAAAAEVSAYRQFRGIDAVRVSSSGE